jgi:hypothetical protein
VVELFRRYTDDGASIADLTRWLTSSNTPTRTGKARWDRSVVWGMLRNPAYAGQAAFGKTRILHESPGLNLGLELALAKATAAITRMIEAFQEQLITLDELRSRIPDLRARENNLRGQLAALDAQIADRDAYLKLADDLEGFLAQLRDNAESAQAPDRQRVLRLLVKDVLIGPEKITIRHRIPVREHAADEHHRDRDASEGDSCPSYPLSLSQ